MTGKSKCPCCQSAGEYQYTQNDQGPLLTMTYQYVVFYCSQCKRSYCDKFLIGRIGGIFVEKYQI